MRTEACLACLAAVRERVDAPLVPMTYASLLEAYGYERFAADAQAAGATSLIVADLPAGAHPELPRIQLVAPTSTDERLRLAADETDGWLYLVSLTGTTGTRDTLSPELEGLVKRARRADVEAALRRLRDLDAGARSGRGRACRRRRRRHEGGRGRRGGPGRPSSRTLPRSAPPSTLSSRIANSTVTEASIDCVPASIGVASAAAFSAIGTGLDDDSTIERTGPSRTCAAPARDAAFTRAAATAVRSARR